MVSYFLFHTTLLMCIPNILGVLWNASQNVYIWHDLASFFNNIVIKSFPFVNAHFNCLKPQYIGQLYCWFKAVAFILDSHFLKIHKELTFLFKMYHIEKILNKILFNMCGLKLAILILSIITSILNLVCLSHSPLNINLTIQL